MKDTCYLLPSGWNFDSHPLISVRRTAAMGDCIAASVVCDRLIEQGFRVVYAVHETFRPLLQLHPGLFKVENQTFTADVHLDGAYETDRRRTTHTFSELFIERANEYLAHRGVKLAVKNCRPRLPVPVKDLDVVGRRLLAHPKPWVIIVPRASIQWKGRQVPSGIWQEAASMIQGTCFWLGQDPAPSGIVDLRAHTIAILPPLLASADLVVSVDTGPMHLAAAVGTPVLAILQNSSPALHLSDQADWWMVGPPLDCLNCQKNVCPKNAVTPPCQQVDPGMIAEAANRRLTAGESVSCVIPIYKPTAERVNRCLAAVVPQVSEVVLTVDASGVVPPGIEYGPKVRLVRARLPRIGVGPNMNHGARYTHGKYILLLNDDVVLRPDAVAEMAKCISATSVGMVGHLLYYPDKSIYHGGKYRPPGGLGWGHIDHRKFRPTVTEPHETENVTGASILVRRSAFYEVNGFDERYFLYNEDDDLCMKFRQAGWKIMYTPHAIGVHEEGQSTQLIGDSVKIMKESQRLFASKWAGYFNHNQQPGLGDFSYA